PRGVLAWEEPRGGGAPSERHLQDLALLWVPDRTSAEDAAVDEENVGEGSGLEIMRDLYRQIQPVDSSASDTAFADALSEAAETLLSASARAGRRGVLP